MAKRLIKDLQYAKFSLYGFLKNLRFFDPYLILFFLESGLDYFHIGILFSIREIATNLFEVPSGFTADLFGRRRAMMSAFLVYIISFLIFYYSGGFWPFAMAMVLFAAGEAFRSGTHKSMIIDYLTRNGMEDEKVVYYGGTRAWSQRGSALSALIAGVLVFLSGSYRTVFVYTLFPYVLGFFLMASYPRYLDFSVESEEAHSGSAEESGNAPPQKQSVSALLKSLTALLKDPVTLRGFVHSSLASAVFKTVKDYIQPMIRNLAVALPLFAGLAEQKRVSVAAGVIYFGIYLLTASASSRAGAVERRFSTRRKALNTSYLAIALVLAVVALFVETPAAVVGIFIFIGLYLLENVRKPMTVGYLGDIVQGRSMATGLSMESQMKTVFVALLSPAFGFLADGFGLTAAMAALAIFTLILYPFLRIREQVQ